jgi:hypothetical protein
MRGRRKSLEPGRGGGESESGDALLTKFVIDVRHILAKIGRLLYYDRSSFKRAVR